jgi:hypothetical protein
LQREWSYPLCVCPVPGKLAAYGSDKPNRAIKEGWNACETCGLRHPRG